MNTIIAMFTNGLNWFEIIVLLVGAICVLVGIKRVFNVYTRVSGWFLLIMSLYHVSVFFVTANGLVSYTIMGISFVISFVLNILSWVILLKMNIKQVISWLRAYLLGVPIVFIGAVAEQFFGAPTQIAEQYTVLITSLAVELFVVWIVKMPDPGDTTGIEDPVQGMTGDESGTDITWMAD